MDALVEKKPVRAPSSSEPGVGVVAASVYSGGRRVADIAIDEVREWSTRPGNVVWIGLFEPDHQLLARLQTQLGLHDLAIEDAGKAHQHPKIEQYGESLFIVARTAQIAEGKIAFGETHLFVGRGYVVSVRHGASASYSAVRARCESCPTTLSHGEDYILYAILDFIVDNYMPVVEAVRRDVDVIEDRVFKSPLPTSEVQRLYTLRRELLQLRNAAAPLAEVCRRLEHTEVMQIDKELQPLFRDVTDHVNRVKEEVDALREVLAFTFEASLMVGQTEQTAITRRLAAWAAILAVPTAIAGIYGMNFEYMPELKWRYGYYIILCAIAAICGTVFWRLRRNGWL
jgi:magnesium transporter